jgi:hypothetical protein
MPYQAIMRNITIGLFEQRRPRLKKGLAMQPVLLSAGTLVNTATHGWNLTASGGTFVGPNVATSRAWYRDAATILNATNSTYLLQAADSGKQVACRIIANNKYGSGYAAALVTVLA